MFNRWHNQSVFPILTILSLLQENICIEKKRSTPLKPSGSDVPVFFVNRKSSTSDLAHITPIKRTVLAEPWSPTANLKVLISAVSPDIRDREMKKVLFRTLENDKDKIVGSEHVVEYTEVEDSTQVHEDFINIFYKLHLWVILIKLFPFFI